MPCRYDLVRGNPNGNEDTMLDEGFRQPVLKLEYTGVSITRDNNFLTPEKTADPPQKKLQSFESDVRTRWVGIDFVLPHKLKLFGAARAISVEPAAAAKNPGCVMAMEAE